MTDRERLVELCDIIITSCKSSLCDDCEHNKIDYPNCMVAHFADHILADGWMKPPCDKVWFIVDKGTKYAMAMPRKTDELPLYMLRDLNKYGYYETKEEAEKALMGGGEE